MRRTRVTPMILAAIGALLVVAPSASASKPGDTEHGVNRAKLAAKAQSMVESRNGIEVLRISRCGPQKRKHKLNYGVWICEWRAQGTYASGDVPYACAGRAVWKRHGNKWRVDRCNNRLQPQAPLLSTPNSPPAFGYNDNWLFDPVAALDLLQASGAQVARLPLPWLAVEGNKGTMIWNGADQLYSRLEARGIRPLWVLVSAPCWAQADPRGCAAGHDQLHPSPSHFGDFANFAAAVAKRYPDSLGLEIWNEPNYPKFWGTKPQPDDYAQMLKTVADTVHSQAPGVGVVSAGLSPHADTDTSGSIGFRNFLIDMYERGAIQHVDAIGIHPYPGVGPTEDYMGDVRVYLGKVQNVMDRYHDSQRPLWATEFGVSTTGDHAFSPTGAGEAVANLLDMFRSIRGIQVAIVHRFIEDPSLGGREAGFGVLTKNLTPKPAFCDLNLLRGISILGVC